MHQIWWISIRFGSKKAFNLLKKLLNGHFTNLSFYFAIFGCILFHQIVFKTFKSFFLSWFLYHRLDLRQFQGCPTFTFCVLGCTEKAKKASFLLNFYFLHGGFVSQKCIIFSVRFVIIVPKIDDSYWQERA